MLWVLARDCFDHGSVQWNPVLLLLKLFSHMDTSAGRRKMAAGSRDARLLPAFTLADPTFHEQIIHHKLHKRRSYDSDDGDFSPSPEKTPQGTHLGASPHENASMATLLKQNYHQSDTPLVPSKGGQVVHSGGKSPSGGKAVIRNKTSAVDTHSIEKKHQKNYIRAKISAHESAMKMRPE